MEIPKDIIIASRNKDKIKELRQLLSGSDIKVYSALDFPELEDVEEDRGTLEGNALKKAEYVFNVTKIPALADDTGLEVDALEGRPGVHSARFAGEQATYAENLAKLMQVMHGIKNRMARFRTVMALVTEHNKYTFEGICEGEIIENKQGNNGFGYDPVFKPAGYGQTFAELGDEVKNKISHRGRAIQKLLDFLDS